MQNTNTKARNATLRQRLFNRTNEINLPIFEFKYNKYFLYLYANMYNIYNIIHIKYNIYFIFLK